MSTLMTDQCMKINGVIVNFGRMTSIEVEEKRNGFELTIYFDNGNEQVFYPVTQEIIDNINTFLVA